MKKLVIFFLMICLCLVGCGEGGKPDNVSQEMYDLAVYAIKVTDLYLDGHYSIGDTLKKLNSISLPELDTDTEYRGDILVHVKIRALLLTAHCVNAETQKISDFKDKRDKLAEEINYKD